MNQKTERGIGIVSSTESESQESERFLFLPIPLLIMSLAIKCELVDRNHIRKQKNQPITKLVPNPFTGDLEWKTWRMIIEAETDTT